MRHARLFLVMIFALCFGLVMQAQTTPVVTPVTSTEGYEFVTTFLPNGNGIRNSDDLKLQFLISSREYNVVGVECGSYKQAYEILAGTTQVIDIPSDYAYWDNNDEYGQVEKPLNLGVRIYSKNGVKMTVYAINQVGTDKSSLTLDGSHVLPIQALGHEYIVTCNKEETKATEFVVMSTKANTNITIQLPEYVMTTKGSNSSITATFTQPYQVYIVRSAFDPEVENISIDLSGTTICADQPVAVWSGNQAALFTTDKPASSDHAFDQLLPIDRWGKEFIVPMTGLNTRINKFDIVARDAGTIVTITKPDNSTESKTLGSAEKWSKLVDEYHGKEGSFATLENKVFVVKTNNKPIQIYLHTSSSVFNTDQNLIQHGDPSMTMISSLEHLTDTAVFATYNRSEQTSEGTIPLLDYELVVWTKNSSISSLKRNGTPIPPSLFKAVPGNSDYKYAHIEIPRAEEGYQIITAQGKCFGGYVCGMEEGQACLYPIGYNFKAAEDSLFLSNQYAPDTVHGSELNTKYPETEFGGGYHLDKVELPEQPTQYDTIFICDSTKLRFPAIIHNTWRELKWEIMRIDQNSQKRTVLYEDENAERVESTDLSNPYLQTKFFVLPEKKDKKGNPIKPENRHPYEDFEVRAIMYRQPTLCSDLEEDQWPKDTLSTIVRTYRSYNDTTWLIKCTNDNDITEDNGIYKFEYFPDPITGEKEILELAVGENEPITRRYTTINGCENDSVVTLCVLLCQSYVKKDRPVWRCEIDLENIHDELELGDFFEGFDFLGTLQECKDQNKNAYGWKWDERNLQWIFNETDIIRTSGGCKDEMIRWHDTYGAKYPRETIGCDSSRTIELRVMPLKTHEYTWRTCKTSYTWTYKENLDYNPVERTVVVNKSDFGGRDGMYDTIRYYKPGGSLPPGSEYSRMCEREKHVLHITFFTDRAVTEKRELCNDADPLVVDKTVEPDIIDPDFSWTFTPRDSVPGVYTSREMKCLNAEGCEYKLLYQVTVNQIDIHRDTVVYCYEDGSQVEHRWSGHTTFWANKKGESRKIQYHEANRPLKINRSRTEKIIYELSDTINAWGDKCHTLYYQTVILQPIYSTSDTCPAISTKEWFEWHDVIWAGDKVDTDTIPNPDNKTIAVLRDYRPDVPEGWEVRYIGAYHTYTLRTTTKTRRYKRDNGSWTADCDSIVELAVQVADEQEERIDTCNCANDKIKWIAGDTTIVVDLSEYKDPANEIKTINLEEHRKTKKPYPVEGIGAHFYLNVTIYPSYETTYEDHACQEIGGIKEFQGIKFKLDTVGAVRGGNPFKTEPLIWTHPVTRKEVEVRCDSGEVVWMHVHPIYTKDVNKELSYYERTLYSHDTLRFFTDPEILLVGNAFMATHPEIRDIEELKSKAGVDSALLIDETLVPALAVQQAWGGYLDTLHVSPAGTVVEGCDSTTFLHLTVRKTIVLDPVNIGDNGNVLDEGVTNDWSFGGDPTGNRRYSTSPVITGDYFSCYYDEYGNFVDSVDYTDDNYDRAKGKDYHYNEDGTRTYLLIDSVLNTDGTYDVYVQYVTVYPTYIVSTSTESVEVCASDTIPWEGHFPVVVSDYVRYERHATVKDVLCSKRYAGRTDSKGNPLCVDSICLLELTVVGNGTVKRNYPRCFNDPAWAPDWARTGTALCYNVNGALSDTIVNDIPPIDPNVTCTDTYVGVLNYQPAYGVEPCEGDFSTSAYTNYERKYIEPYNYDAGDICRYYDDYHWMLKDNITEHIPENLYLYDKDDNPMNIYPDENGNPNKTNKVPRDILRDRDTIPTSLDLGEYIVRDSLHTVGCYCDSVLSLHYTIIDGSAPINSKDTICVGETRDFGGQSLTAAGTYEDDIQVPGMSCKQHVTLELTVVDAPKFYEIKPAPVCFGDRTYAINYKYKDGHYPVSYSVDYDEASEELGFVDITDQKIDRPESEWKEDSTYVLDLPIPHKAFEDYPAPGVFSATIGFKNGVCSGDEMMTYPFDVKVNYPGWILKQRYNDLIVLLDTGNHEWTSYQWYRDGVKMTGYTKPYLYVPGGLNPGSEYYVVLTEKDATTGDDTAPYPTCPITVKSMENSGQNTGYGPIGEYIAVTPTCVPVGGSIYILSSEDGKGTYRICTIDGQYCDGGPKTYQGKATLMDNFPSIEGMYIVQVWSDNKESKESYRAVKVIVRSTCPNCDKSSF